MNPPTLKATPRPSTITNSRTSASSCPAPSRSAWGGGATMGSRATWSTSRREFHMRTGAVRMVRDHPRAAGPAHRRRRVVVQAHVGAAAQHGLDALHRRAHRRQAIAAPVRHRGVDLLHLHAGPFAFAFRRLSPRTAGAPRRRRLARPRPGRSGRFSGRQGSRARRASHARTLGQAVATRGQDARPAAAPQCGNARHRRREPRSSFKESA